MFDAYWNRLYIEYLGTDVLTELYRIFLPYPSVSLPHFKPTRVSQISASITYLFFYVPLPPVLTSSE